MNFSNKNTGHIDLDIEIKSFKQDDDFFVFSAYASTFGNIDKGNDVIMKGAFDESIKNQKDIKLLWQHDMDQPIGVFTSMKIDDVGLFVEGKLPKEDTLVKGRVIPQMKIGSINSMSIGFSLSSDDIEFRKGENGVVKRIIHKVKLIEISLVTLPMNDEAKITSFKAAVPFQDLPFKMDGDEIDFNITWASSDAINRIREFTGSNDSPSSDYKNAFLWYDRENKDDFGAYKLPIADIIDGNMFVVPRAVFSATAAIRGARGGIDIPENEKEAVISVLNKYYKKMDRESPFEKSFSPLLDSLNSITDASNILKSFGFSNNETNSFINLVKRTGVKYETKEVKEFVSCIKEFSDKIKSNS